MKKRKKTWFKSNLVFIPYIFLLTIVCIYTCFQACYNLTRDHNKVLDMYATDTKSSISNAINQIEYISKYSYLTDNIDHEFNNLAELLLFFDNTDAFINSISESTNSSITIYTSNPHLINGKHFLNKDYLKDFDKLISSFQNSNITIQCSGVLVDSDNKAYINIYKYMFFNPNHIIENRLYLPKTDSGIQIKESTKIENNELYSCFLNDYAYVMQTSYSEYIVLCLKIILCFIVLGILSILLISYLTRHSIQGFIHNFQMYVDEHNTIDLQTLNIPHNVNLQPLVSVITALVKKLNKYSEINYKKENELQQLQGDLLRQQLDPHTLYNSLAAIRLHASMNKDTETITLIDLLVNYYRDILDKNRGNSSTLFQEISTINKFIKICSLSHDQLFLLNTDISPDALKAECLPMLLHPFVENAIIHGLSGLNDECIIDISAEIQNDLIIIKVQDNGRGISSENLKKINDFSSCKKGYGLYNSYKRLKTAYGDNGNIVIESKQGQYTIATISFKYIGR